MKKTLPLLLLILALVPRDSSAGPQLPTLIPADDPRIQYSGRIDFTDPKAPRFDWSGVSISVRFKGNAVGFFLVDGANNYNLTVDGKPATVWATTKAQTEYIAGHLKKGEHLARLSKRTEGYFGIATFKGVLLPKDGALLEAPPKPTRRIEFLGASWTCGYGNEGTSIHCPDLRPLENADLAFGPVAARMLGAEWHVTAYSGKGICRNYGAPKADSPDPYGILFDRTVQGDANLKWDFTAWVPDVVVINLGVNDYSTQPAPDPKVFISRYVELLGRVRAAYPKAWIVAFDATGWPDYLQYVQAAVAEFKKRGDGKTLSLEFPPYPPSEHACDYHPSVAADRQIAENLVPQISKLWAEDTTPAPDSAATSTPVTSDPSTASPTEPTADGAWNNGVKHEAFRYAFKGPLDEAMWERAQYSIDDSGSLTQPTDASDGAEALTLFVNRLAPPVGQHPFTAAGIQSRAFYGHGRFTVRMKSNIKSGTVSSFFLMNKWEPGRWFHKEIDIEFLGKDPRTVQFVTHRYYSDQGPQAMGHAHVVQLPFGYGDGFHDYSILWTKDKVEWSVDGKRIWETAENVPDVPLAIMMNHWGPDPTNEWSKNWVGPMDLDALPSKAEYQWVRYEPE